MTRSKSFIDELKASFDIGSHDNMTLVPPDYEKREFISKSSIIESDDSAHQESKHRFDLERGSSK